MRSGRHWGSGLELSIFRATYYSSPGLISISNLGRRHIETIESGKPVREQKVMKEAA